MEKLLLSCFQILAIDIYLLIYLMIRKKYLILKCYLLDKFLFKLDIQIKKF